MSTKLRNIDAIKKMLDGTHKTQTSNKVGFSDVKQSDNIKAVGDVWTDEKGVEWEQRNGFRIQKGKLDELRELIAKETQMPSHCPECNQPMTKRLDKKFWKLDKRCFDCQVDFEHNLRIEGKYKEYESERMRKNAEAWLEEAEKEATQIIEAFRNPLSFVNSDGTIEEWAGGMSAEEMADKIEEEFKQFKENFLKQLQPIT